jgi:hypothetical protein
MSHRLSRAAITAIRYPVVITLVLVFALGSLVRDGQSQPARKPRPKPTTTTPALSTTVRPAFQGFPIDQPQSIDLEIDENTTAGFSNRERLDQIRDWLLFTVISDAGLTADATNKILFDLPSSRRGYMVPVASFEYGSTRSRVIGNGRIVVLLSQTNNEAARADELAQVVDQHRKNLGELPSSVTVFDYTVDADSNTAQLTRRTDVSAQQFFTEANGYFETRVGSLNDLERFMRQIDDITYASLDNGTLVLGGRKVKGRTYRGIRVEDVAAIWQSEKAIRAKQNEIESFNKNLEDQFRTAWQTYRDVVNSLSRENVLDANIALQKLRALAATDMLTRAQIIRGDSPDSSLSPATLAYQTASRVLQAYNTVDVATYNQLVNSMRAVPKRQAEALVKYRDEKIRGLQTAGASGFSLDPTYDFEGLSKFFKDELEPLLRKIAAKNPSLVSVRDIERIQSGFTANDADPFFLTLGKLSKGGHKELASVLEHVLEQRYAFQQARYDGELKGTEVGMVLFYTDLLAKLWAFDYMKSTPSRDIADFYAMTDGPISVAHKANIESAPSTRLWFGPQNKGFQFAKNPSTSVLFSRVAARVYSASSDPYNPGVEVEANAASAAFLGWWDAHYDEIARYEPEYERLNEIMKWSVLIGWLNNADNLSALNFLSSVTVSHSNVFPEWVQRHANNLRFKEWDKIGFYPAGYKESETETLPLLSWDFSRFGERRTLSGGVSLAGRKTFSTRTPLTRQVNLPDTVRRSDLNYTPPKGPRTPNSFSNFEGTNWRSSSLGPNKSELVAVAKKGNAFRDGAAELRSDLLVKRTSTLSPEGMSVKTVAGNVEVSDLNIAQTTNGFKVGAQSRAMDTGHAIARRLSVADNPEAFLKTAPNIEEAFVLEKSGEFVIKLHRSDKWLRVGREGLSTPNAQWESRVAEFGTDAGVLRLNWISEAQGRGLARTGRTVRAASENTGVARVDAFLAENKPVDALRALDELPSNELSGPDRLLRRAIAQIARNRERDAYKNLQDVFDGGQDVNQLFNEFNARLSANKLLPEGDQFVPVQDGQQISLVYRKRNLGKPLTADEAKAIDPSGAYLYVQDSKGLGNLDWTPGMEARTLQQVIAKDLGEIVELPRGDIARFRPAFITDGGGPGRGGPAGGATHSRTFRSVRESKPDSLLRTSTIIPCVDSDKNDPAKRHNDDRSVPCAKRDDKDRPAYVIVAK